MCSSMPLAPYYLRSNASQYVHSSIVLEQWHLLYFTLLVMLVLVFAVFGINSFWYS